VWQLASPCFSISHDGSQAGTFSHIGAHQSVCIAEAFGEHDLKPTTPLGGREALASGIRKVKVMPLIQLVEVLIVVGVVLWLVNRFIPMQQTIKSILNAVVVISVVLWLLNVSGLLHSFSRMRVGP
jgi:hypothetical protein